MVRRNNSNYIGGKIKVKYFLTHRTIFSINN